ncbi:patatin-like phospholipase family protein [Shewanella corallii]|uniref:Patatin-like phospholipase family protein n=1 Tax=Shewanella corallii TaxID=560080 RepID=A0ABT0NAM6_9GAMM|nr:patatin-like phospholipase family protein [Shewanella corallii]MCL2915468.1 patatin-like phospholipase family protein [Shewanella corallii]
MQDVDTASWITRARTQADMEIANRQEQLKDKVFSHIVDDDGNQYVDLVMEGGGMLGIALVGFTYVLEQQGLRFRKVAGTSAGAINALMTAALDVPGKPKSQKVLEILDSTAFDEFMDGPDYVKKVIRKVLNKDSGWSYVWSARSLYKTFRQVQSTLGLNPGNRFLEWATEILNEHAVYTVADLESRVNSFPPLYICTSEEAGKIPSADAASGAVALIATDITTESRAVFPKDAPLYWQDTEELHPAHFVRASMSVPLFFEPMVVNQIPQGKKAMHLFEDLRNIKAHQFKYQRPPEQVRFVDGGMVSNFPFDIFHLARASRHAPRAPTIGVKLEDDVYQHNTDTFLQYLGAVVNTSRRMFDNHLRVVHSADYDELVSNIPIKPEIQWLNFEMPPEHKYDLFMSGVDTALNFLQRFEFNDYLLNVRLPLMQQH